MDGFQDQGYQDLGLKVTLLTGENGGCGWSVNHTDLFLDLRARLVVLEFLRDQKR
jgi:hypothetical protein